MKNLRNILIGGVCMLLLVSCSKWLDVNQNPNQPDSSFPSYSQRLAPIEFYTNSAQQFSNYRSNIGIGDIVRKSANYQYWNAYWRFDSGISTTSYQWWFVGAACNLNDLIKSAEAAEAWHYVGVAKVIWAYGMMMMTDLYGEMPYDEAVGESATPKYNDGKEIYLGCLKSLEEGLEYLQKPQGPNADPLSVGDYWGNGDVQKWIKFANLLKARYGVKLSKKAKGALAEGKYDEQAILDALAKGPQSIADNMVIYHTDNNSSTHDNLGWDEPVDYSPLYSVVGMNSGIYCTAVLFKNLTNFAGYGVEDPRAKNILPWQISTKTPGVDYDALGVKWDGDWRRTIGVDMSSNIVAQGGPLRSSYSAAKHWYIDSENAARLGDTLYVETTSSSKGYAHNVDLLYRRDGTNDSRESGSFYTRVSAPTYIGTYAEACFIKAEVLFNKGDKNGAYEAYKNGVKASMDEMNVTLNNWLAGDATLGTCPSFKVITESEINSFLQNGIGKASDLTLGHIMTQKRIAMLLSVESFNDIRRYDYNSDIFFNWQKPAHWALDADAQRTMPAGREYRRWMQCPHESNYNATNLNAIGEKVKRYDPNVVLEEGKSWATRDDIWSIHVWWDTNVD